ncbi:MAG: hypothetical protein WKG00_22395 [Polyangiaceae bacterium]
MRELRATEVSHRLEGLRRAYRAETDTEARQRLERERPARDEPFATAVSRRLAELRALLDLASYLHGGGQGGQRP